MYKIGIDLGGTNIAVGLVEINCNGENVSLVKTNSVPTLKDRHYTEVIKDMANAVSTLLKEANVSASECVSIGVGSPGTSHEGVVVYSNNIRWDYVPLAEELGKYFDLPIFLDNDANCAALGEVFAGAAKGHANAVMLTYGTGVGTGIIIDGKIYSGSFSAGAEFGHSMLILGGENCTCGRRGCYEAYASATSLIRDAKRAALKNAASLLNTLSENDPEKIDGALVFKASEQGDAVATEVIDQYLVHISEGIIDIVNIFRPEVIIIGGGICNAGDRVLVPVNEYVSKNCYGSGTTPTPPVVRATLGGDAGIIGAALLG